MTVPPKVAVIGFGPSGMSFQHAVDHRRKQLKEEGNTAALAELPDVTYIEQSVSITSDIIYFFAISCFSHLKYILLHTLHIPFIYTVFARWDMESRSECKSWRGFDIHEHV